MVNLLLVVILVISVGVWLKKRGEDELDIKDDYSDGENLSSDFNQVREVKDVNLPSDLDTAFLFCTFSMLGKLATYSSKTFSKEEATKVRNYVLKTKNLNRKSKSLAIKVFKQAMLSPLDVEDYVTSFKETFPDSFHLHDKMVHTLLEAFTFNGSLSPKEDTILKDVALELGVSEPVYKQIRSNYISYEPMIH